MWRPDLPSILSGGSTDLPVRPSARNDFGTERHNDDNPPVTETGHAGSHETVISNRDSASSKINHLPNCSRRHPQLARNTALIARDSADTSTVFRRFHNVTNSNGAFHAPTPACDLPGGVGRTPGRPSHHHRNSRERAPLPGRASPAEPAYRAAGTRADTSQRPQPVSLPSVNDLVHVALAETDFLGDLDTGDLGWLEHIAANSIDAAADIWSDVHANVPVPLWLCLAARRELVLQAQCLLTDRAEAEADALRDAQDAGDADADGNPIPYPRYRGA